MMSKVRKYVPLVAVFAWLGCLIFFCMRTDLTYQLEFILMAGVLVIMNFYYYWAGVRRDDRTFKRFDDEP